MWLQWLTKILTAAPYIVAGIESIHTEAKQGAAKKQLAMDALGLSAATASAFVPPDLQPAVKAATELASQTIDGIVAVMNAAKGTPAAPEATPTQ